VLSRALIKRHDREAEGIRGYVEWQSPKEKVQHLEKITTEHLPGRRFDVWDVHTTGERYWVIASPINLYSQRLFPSMDYTLSFHVGVTTRMLGDRKASVSNVQQDRLAAAWRRWFQAADAFDRADEADEFQAVGMRCRQCLLALISAAASNSMVPTGEDPPKSDDFIHWSELIANSIASGQSAEEVRAYLKTVAKSTWQLGL
jgi:hypothetical protein